MQDKSFEIKYICLRHIDVEHNYLFGIHEVYWVDGVPEEICQIPVIYDESLEGLRDKLKNMLEVTHQDIPLSNTE